MTAKASGEITGIDLMLDMWIGDRMAHYAGVPSRSQRDYGPSTSSMYLEWGRLWNWIRV